MPRKGTRKSGSDGLEEYRKRQQEEREKRFHEAAEPEDTYDWRKRPSTYESRTKKTIRKLGTTGQIISRKAKTGDDRTKYKTRNGVTWRVTKTEQELKQEAEEAEERERLRKKRSYEHRKDKGRPVTARYLIKLNVVNYPKPYYFGGDEIGWTTYECALQYLGEKTALMFARRMINTLKLEDNTDRFDSIEVISIPKELHKEWLYAENVNGKFGAAYKEIYETREEYVEKKKEENKHIKADCDNCICINCGFKNPLETIYCDKCFMCKQKGDYEGWKDECKKYIEARGAKNILL